MACCVQAKLVAKWRAVEAEVKDEQQQRLKSLKFRHAALLSEMEESQGRELEQFRTVFELQAQLKQAESKSKVELVSFVSHEIRNPLVSSEEAAEYATTYNWLPGSLKLTPSIDNTMQCATLHLVFPYFFYFDVFPQAGVSGLVDLLTQEPDISDEHRKFLHDIQSECSLMKQILVCITLHDLY